LEINNPRTGLPSVRFYEDRVVQLGDIDVVTPCSQLFVEADQSKMIAIIDPTTGSPTGQTMAQGAIYVLLYSAYLQHAADRDAAQQAQMVA
jgi:hypothetical protein